MMVTKYMNGLRAEQLIMLIANAHPEYSNDPIIRICREWIKANSKIELDPDLREWEYDGCGNRVIKGNYNESF